jgi:uncharacterized protein YbaP (TraB family)
MLVHRLLAFIFIIVGVAGARTALAEAMPFSDGVLWRVERADGAASYVFGTLHSTDERVTSLPRPVSDAFAASKTLAVECILDNSANLKVIRAMLLPGGERLDASLSATQVARLKGVAADYHMPFTMVTRFKPWGAMMLFSLPPSEHLRAASGLKPLDERLRAQAEAAGKTVFGLETVDEQIATLDGMVPADQMLMLDSTLQDAGQIERVFAGLRDAYLARDLVTVYGLLNAEKSGDATGAVSRFEQRLIIDRNRRMVERMDKLLRQGNAFVAVGALHLPGAHGILQLLSDEGYQVTRVY